MVVVGGAALLNSTCCRAPENEPQFRELLARHFPQLSVGEPQAEAGQLRYIGGLPRLKSSASKISRSIGPCGTIRNRIDQFGVAEPDIRKQSDNRIQVQLPGISDPRRAVRVIGQTAHLEFHLVREDVDLARPCCPRRDRAAHAGEKTPASSRKKR